MYDENEAADVLANNAVMESGVGADPFLGVPKSQIDGFLKSHMTKDHIDFRRGTTGCANNNIFNYLFI